MPEESRSAKILTSVSVTTDCLPPKERFDFLNDIYTRERLILAPRQPIGRAISAGSSLWQVGSLRYARTHSSGHLGRRVKGKGPVFLAVRKHLTAGCHSWAEDGYFGTKPGDILVTTNSSDGVHACIGLTSTNIALPIEMVDIDPRTFPSTQILRVGTLANSLISLGMESWTARLQNLPREKADLLQDEIISLINHVLGHSLCELERDLPYQGLRGIAIRQYIENRLLDNTLTINEIAKSFGASRSSIYREFANEGGVRRYVTLSRLRRALFMLTKSPAERGAVGTIARRLGYSDTFAFSKAFRNHFGFSPTEALALPSGLFSDCLAGGGPATLDQIN